MSYQFHDHARWVERNNAAINRMWAGSRAKRTPAVMPETLTDFQAKSMDILGMVFGGIYNAPFNWQKVDWMPGDYGVRVPFDMPRSMATTDYSQLTTLVFLCHEARIRAEISTERFSNATIMLSPRTHEGGMSRRHPDLAEAIERFREYLPADHRIIYRANRIAVPLEEPAQ